MRKFLSVTLTLILLFSMAVPVLATTNDTESTETRTVEEILNEYHEKSFAAEMAEETGNPTAYSNRDRSSGKTLEEETVDELRAAGYEAYNVTSSNYDSLEASLKTDFEEMGLDPNSSYIITISGEPSSNARGFDPPTQDYYEGGGSSFPYTYNGTTYSMRYVTVTSASEPSLSISTKYDFSKVKHIEDYAADIGSAIISLAIDEAASAVVPKLPLSTILSLLVDWSTDEALTITNPDEIVLYAGTTWTRKYIQIRNDANNGWYTALYTSYAVSRARCVGGYVYNPATNTPEFAAGNEHTKTTYSMGYNDSENLKATAVTAYLSNYQTCYCTGDISFYFITRDGTINFNGDGKPLFIHEETLAAFLPKDDYDN